jgi:hypothetical protein
MREGIRLHDRIICLTLSRDVCYNKNLRASAEVSLGFRARSRELLTLHQRLALKEITYE